MLKKRIIPFFLILSMALVSFGPALAAAPKQALPPCEANPETGKLSGTVVAVDGSTGMVTVDPGDGVLCTVNISVDESHPIVLLLGKYFGDFDSTSLETALADVQGCASTDGTTWSWVDPVDGSCPEGSVAVKVTGTNEDGSFTAVNLSDNSMIDMLNIGSEETASQVQGALAALAVEWSLEGAGNLSQVSDQIAAYHDDGMGFGVLVKLYAIAQSEQEKCDQVTAEGADPCLPATVEELTALFQSGVGMGQIFKEYGKPDKLGVGHVRQDLKQDQETVTSNGKDKNKNKNKNGSDQLSDDQSAPPAAVKNNGKPANDNNKLKGICNAVSKNGKPKKGVTCP